MKMCTPNLLDLPNCIILQLLTYLDATSLYLLSKTCCRLDELIQTASFWKFIDARRAPNDPEKISYCTDRIHPGTHTILVRADSQQETLIPPHFYFRINIFNTLRILAIENQTIDGGDYTIMSFPKSLHELSLKKTVVVNSLEFIRNSGEHLKNLRVLILDECNWVNCASFMALSKYSCLEILSVYKCKNIENSIPYLSLAGQYGFKKLKIFDARLSSLGNTLIRSLYRSQSLLAIYLQNEDISYKLDYFKRKLQIIKGAKTRDYYVEDDEFDLNDSLTNEENGLNYENSAYLDDHGFLDYLSAVSSRDIVEMPKSFLYLDPYNKCTCGYEESQRKKLKNDKRMSPPVSPHDSDDSDDSDGGGGGGGDFSLREIANKIARLSEIIHRSQENNTWSRGLFNHNHPRSPSDPLSIIDVRSLNGDLHRSDHDFKDSIVLNLVQEGARAPSRPSPFLFQYRRHLRFRLRGHDNNDNNQEERSRHIIDIHINPSNGSRESGSEVRKRPHLANDEPETKKSKTENGEPEPGPSGLNNPSQECSDDSDFSELDDNEQPNMERPPTPHPDVVVNNPPNEKNEEYRRIHFRDSPIVRISNLDEIAKDNKVPIRRLSLRGYKRITNTSLGYIKDLNLELLDLTYTNVSAEGINNYLIDHPFCRIVHEEFCVCPTNLHF